MVSMDISYMDLDPALVLSFHLPRTSYPLTETNFSMISGVSSCEEDMVSAMGKPSGCTSL